MQFQRYYSTRMASASRGRGRGRGNGTDQRDGGQQSSGGELFCF